MAYDQSFQTRVWPIIISLMETYVSPVFDGRLSKDVAVSLTQFPVGVYQSQDAGGKNDDFISHNGWSGLVTIRSIDITQSGAMNNLTAAAQAFLTAVHPNYDLLIKLNRPITFPVEKLTTSSIYTAGVVIDLGIYPKT